MDSNEYKLINMQLVAKTRTVDIRNLSMAFNIYNDLFLEFITADVLIVDSMNLIKRLPIVGGEELILEFQDHYNNPAIKLSFIVWKIAKQESQSQTNQIYKLQLVSPNWYKSMSMKNMRHFNNEPVNIIKSLYNETKHNVVHQPSFNFIAKTNKERLDVNGGGLTPFELIRKVTFLSHDVYNAPLLTYHDLQGFNVESYTHIINKKPYVELFLEPTQQTDHQIDKTRICDDWFRLDNQNKAHIDQKGSQRTNNIVFSLNKKNLHIDDFDYKRDFSQLPSLEDVPLDRIDVPSFKPRCFISDNPVIAKQANIRTALFTMLEDNVLYLNISGDTKYVPGTIIQMDIPSKETAINGYQKEEDLSGRFLITSTKHMIRRDSYRTVIEIMKESLVRRL